MSCFIFTNQLISRLSLISLSTTLGLLTITSFTSPANAQTVNSGQVEMTATINGFCLFENELDGTLGVSPSDLTTLNSSETANSITALDGASGSIDVTCNDATTTINIDTVTESNTAGATVNTFTTTVSGLASDIVSTDGAPGTPVAVGSTNTETLNVDLTATYNDNLSAGDYTYTVNLVANP